VDDPRLQQRSVKREATTPARRKMTVDTQNPMVGGLDEQSSSRAAAGSLSLAGDRPVGEGDATGQA